MARVKMLKTAAGPNGVRLANTVVDLGDDEALGLVEAGAAAFLEVAKVPETAMLGTQETAVMPAARARRRRNP